MKILIVDDEPLARQRLRTMLGELADAEVVGEADNGREAVEKAESLAADAVLMDIAMPVMDGLEAARHLARGEDLIEESLKSLELEFADRFQRIHRNCLVANEEFLELRRQPDGQVQAILRHGKTPLEVSRRCVPTLRDKLRHL
jgi:DNA-binding LytR/AlgR family response regulator